MHSGFCFIIESEWKQADSPFFPKRERRRLIYIANDRLTKVDAGFDRQTIYTNIAFTPIRFYTDSEYKKITIYPKLTDGLSFDEDLGQISGVYTGKEQVVEYTVTAVYNDQTASTVIVLEYKSRSNYYQMMQTIRSSQQPVIPYATMLLWDTIPSTPI